MFACITSAESAKSADGLLRLAFCFSPRVEPIAPDTIILDIDGLEQLFGPPVKLSEKIAHRAAEFGLQTNIAIAQDVETAIYAARGLAVQKGNREQRTGNSSGIRNSESGINTQHPTPNTQHLAGVTVIPPGEEAKTLSNLPLHLLPAMPELQDTWKLWGLKSFGDLAALPETGVAERLGAEGARLHRIARGAEVRPLIPWIPAIDYHAAEELEHPVELLDPLSFILASLLNQVCASLEARGLAVSELHIELKLESPVNDPQMAQIPQKISAKSAKSADCKFERRLSLPVPLRDSIALLKLLRLDLEAHPPQAPVIAVSLRASPAKPRVTQNSLFIPPAPEPQKLELTLARIKKLVGEGNAGAPALVDTHRPGAFEMRPFRLSSSNPSRDRKGAVAAGSHGERFSRGGLVAGAQPKSEGVRYQLSGVRGQKPNTRHPTPDTQHPLSFRVFRPPLVAEVECYQDEPLQVRARGIRGKVVSYAGPWRSSGDWWTPDPWDREEWDIQLAPLSRMRRTREIMGREQSATAPEGRNILAHGVSRGYASPKHPSPGGAKEKEESDHICRPSGALASSGLQTHDSRRGLDSTAPSGAAFSQRITQRGNSLYRIYRNVRTGAWYIEGSYD